MVTTETPIPAMVLSHVQMGFHTKCLVQLSCALMKERINVTTVKTCHVVNLNVYSPLSRSAVQNWGLWTTASPENKNIRRIVQFSLVFHLHFNIYHILTFHIVT